MPQYMLLIYNPASGGPSPEEMAAEAPRWEAYTRSLVDDGVLRGGAPLHGTESATTVRVRDHETQLVDGPFAETKEYLAGFYLVECRDLDGALACAARAPAAAYGSVEVRPVVALPGS